MDIGWKNGIAIFGCIPVIIFANIWLPLGLAMLGVQIICAVLYILENK